MKSFGFKQLLISLWPYIKRQKNLLRVTVAAIILLALVGRILPALIGLAIDEGIIKDDLNYIVKICIAYGVLEIIRTLLLFSHRFLFFKLGNQVLFDLRNDLIEHVQKLPAKYFDKIPSGKIVTRVTNDVVSLGDLFTQGLVGIFSNALSIVFILVAMSLISVKLSVVTLITAPILIYIGISLSNKIRSTLKIAKRKVARINAFIAENVNGMKVIQVFNRIDKNKQYFSRLSETYRQTQLKAVRLYALLWPTMNFFNAAAIVTAVFYGGYLNQNEALKIGALIAFIIHVQDFVHPLRFILEKYQQLQNSLTGAERIFEILGEPTEDYEGLQLENLKGHIEFKNVSFRYGAHLPYVLKNMSFEIEPGEQVALVGRTGSGKSTIIGLLQRFYDIEEGEILIDGVNINKLSRTDLRQKLGVVQQDPFMFKGSIKDNVSLGDQRISEEAIIKALKDSYSDGIVKKHGGLDAEVKERGENLSQGERQLISFARILAFDPAILVLDEATANIDSQSEHYIQKATEIISKDRTSIFIAHRLSTIVNSDKIIVLKNGELIEVGNHSELLENRSEYFELCKNQFNVEEIESRLETELHI